MIRFTWSLSLWALRHQSGHTVILCDINSVLAICAYRPKCITSAPYSFKAMTAVWTIGCLYLSLAHLFEAGQRVKRVHFNNRPTWPMRADCQSSPFCDSQNTSQAECMLLRYVIAAVVNTSLDSQLFCSSLEGRYLAWLSHRKHHTRLSTKIT